MIERSPEQEGNAGFMDGWYAATNAAITFIGLIDLHPAYGPTAADIAAALELGEHEAYAETQ